MAPPASTANGSTSEVNRRSDDVTWRPLSSVDIPAWHRMVSAAGAVDRADENFTEADLADELGSPNVDPPQDTLAAVTAAGEVLAAGLSVSRPAGGPFRRYDLWGAVHPADRGQGLGRRLLAWQIDRATRRHRDEWTPVEGWVGAGMEDHRDDLRRLFTRAGMTPLRWYTGLVRPLAVPIAAPGLPAGVRLVPFDLARSEQARLAHNEAWLDHWGYSPRTPEFWQAWGPGHRNFRADWSFLAVDESDAIVGYIVNFAWQQEWEVKGRTEGYTELVGVLKPWRGKGLASALLAASNETFRAAGMQCAALDVDSDNPTGALRLYQSLGYQPKTRTALMALRLDPAPNGPAPNG